MDTAKIYHAVQERYSAASKATHDDHRVTTVAQSFGYTQEDLLSIPQEANLGLSCGNPLAIAALKEGETVVDLGCGAGFDVFLASQNVGPTGRSIGVDRNQDMLAKARRNQEVSGMQNIEFFHAPITDIRVLPQASADCIISNCVVNLVPEREKQLVFKEMSRILKPGGRVAISDILTKQDIPWDIAQDMALYVGCVAGASRVDMYEKYLETAGFGDVLIVDAMQDINQFKGSPGKDTSGCCADVPSNHSFVHDDEGDPKPEVDFNEFAGSYKIFAVKS